MSRFQVDTLPTSQGEKISLDVSVLSRDEVEKLCKAFKERYIQFKLTSSMLDRAELIAVDLRWDRFEKLVLEVIGKPLEKLSSPSDADYRFKADPALQMQRSGADSSLDPAVLSPSFAVPSIWRVNRGIIKEKRFSLGYEEEWSSFEASFIDASTPWKSPIRIAVLINNFKCMVNTDRFPVLIISLNYIYDPARDESDCHLEIKKYVKKPNEKSHFQRLDFLGMSPGKQSEIHKNENYVNILRFIEKLANGLKSIGITKLNDPTIYSNISEWLRVKFSSQLGNYVLPAQASDLHQAVVELGEVSSAESTRTLGYRLRARM